MGKTYQQPKLVMYRGMTRTGCGAGQSIMGPFYCPADGTVYIDLSFYDDMKDKLGADGDFARGYVIAHEVGHHVQKLLGIEPKVRQLQQNATQAEVNRLSVRMELGPTVLPVSGGIVCSSKAFWKPAIWKRR